LSSQSTTMMAVLLIVGLAIGAGVGYFMAPTKTETITETVTVEKEPLAGKKISIGNIIAATPELEWNVPYYDNLVKKDMNDYAALLGYDVTFDILNDDAQSQGAIHLEKVQSFKAMDVNLVIGGRWSSQASAALSYVTENNMLLWSPSSTDPKLRIADDNLYRMCPDDTYQAPGIALMMWDYGIEAVIIIQRADSWADGIYNIFEPLYQSLGGVIAERIRYATDATEYSSYLASADVKAQELVAQYGVEHVAVEVICFGEDGSVLLTQVEDYPTLYSLMWFGNDGPAMSNIIADNAAEAADHLIIPSTYAAPGESPVYEDLYWRYLDTTGRTFGYYDACGYDISMVLLESVLEAQSTDPEDIIPLQQSITYKRFGASGWNLLNEAGDRAQYTYDIWGFKYLEGKIVFVRYAVYDGLLNTVTWFSEGKVLPLSLEQAGTTVPGLVPVGH
jgi:ABC-type branched-subunit amino acid transport system substrate-binding protein